MANSNSRVDELIDKLSEIHPKGFDLSLGRITALLDKLGNPHLRIPPVFHVAGTNGKGSTLAFIRSILEAAGYKVHVHTSPHLVNWNERYRLAGKLVDDDTLADAIERVTEANSGKPITIFEIMSAVMFLLFSEHDADFSLVEVGLGGRFDATNVIPKPLVSAIAPVSLDHQAYLGDTIAKIAFEKAGIIKEQTPVVVGLQEDEARDVIEEVANTRSSSVQVAGQDFDFYRDATGFVFQDGDGLLDLPMPNLAGEHQLVNAALAISAVRAADIKVPEKAFSEGMQNVVWPGRLEKLPSGKITEKLNGHRDVWIDGGHNPDAGKAIATELLRQNKGADRKTVLICGMINTKEPLGYFQPFTELSAEVITVPVAMSEAGISPEELAKIAREAGLTAETADTLEQGIVRAATIVEENEEIRILFCGSVYMVGEVLNLNDTPPQ
ncbi:MAG: folylpolyglutamate synthase/dihydrofolate synthase family protein [Pseudomonadota bacterium]